LPRSPTPSGPSLVVLGDGPARGRRIALAKERILVGRDPTCDVRIDRPRVSRLHAALRHRDSTVVVTDLGSAGGTFVNGMAVIAPSELRHGDVVAFADVPLRYDSGQPFEGPGQRARHQDNSADRYGAVPRTAVVRDVAAIKAKARRLLRIGVVSLLVGLALSAYGVIPCSGGCSKPGFRR